jgi:hypothetical protein
MLPVTIKQAKTFFFDRQAVMNPMDRVRRHVLSRAGAVVRVIARRSMKQVGPDAPPSAPGTPPRSRKGLLKKFLYYVYDPTTEGVIVGPALLSGRRSIPVPALHEHGGTARVTAREVRWRTEQGQRVKEITKRRVVTSYPRRPYMQPALEKVIPRMPEFWRDVLNR